MLATMVPLFKTDMSVASYCLYAQRENLFENPHLLGTGQLDGAGSIIGLEVLKNLELIGVPTDRHIILLINNISLFADIDSQVEGFRDRIMLLMDTSVKPDESYGSRLAELKGKGYKLAFRNIKVTQIEEYKPLLQLVDMIFVNADFGDPVKQGIICNKLLPGVPLAVENIRSQEDFEVIRDSELFDVFEGTFYRVPINTKDVEVSPLKINYLQLMNIVNQADFDLTDVAGVVSRDTALSISLLSTVNKLTLNSNISSLKQATALLGQNELKRWINTSVLKELCADRPTEIVRLSLIRARFAENMASMFDMGMRKDELFLLGLVSVLDYILDRPMDVALKTVSVSKDIFDALVEGSGELSKLWDFEIAYESGNWQEVSRLMLLHKLDMNYVYGAYIDALRWYKEMFL